MHRKPCGLLNVCGYYERLIAFLDHTVDEAFVNAKHRGMVLVEDNPEALLDRFETYQPPTGDKAAWILKMSKGLGS